ncbi:protein kinase [Granulicella sp. WH15]|uniref:protein kinase n=1 Tax=Granulicella sp. WH15 TaxID=2602070 RepID=UPI0013A583D4|nr:protein kinase [Granulicella sp. WH15]
MHLWNDYEGQIIADAYPLKKLLRPEGRSAFFITPSKDGNLDVIRLTESLNDEHEMLALWRQVSEVHQPNLVTIKSFGKTTFDGVRLTYALMESPDANLADILKERPLTPAETTEVALSVAAALSALHATSLIHTQVAAANVVATGEVIKLRSDCVRECIPDPEFNPPAECQALRQRDVHDLGLLLLECLTLDRNPGLSGRLPAPFHQVIPKAVDGSWGLAEIVSKLAPPAPTPAPTPAVSAEKAAQNGAAQPTPSATKPQPATPPVVETKPAAEPAEAPLRMQTPHLHRVETESPEEPFRLARRWLPIGAAGLILILCIWLLNRHSSPKPTVTPALQTEAPAAAAPAPEPAPTPQPTTAAPATTSQPGWHVIAYTFNHEDQAQIRIQAIEKQHPGLNPQLFTPTGRSPYFVALGGVMSQREAEAVRNRARRSGLPLDTFSRFYK